MSYQIKELCIAIQLDDKFFDDEDHLALKACTYLCKEFEKHLISKNHKIPEWLKNGGCEEDWGVYFESEIEGNRLKILFGYYPEADQDESILIRIYPFLPFFKGLFSKPKPLSENLKKEIIEFKNNFDKTKVYEK